MIRWILSAMAVFLATAAGATFVTAKFVQPTLHGAPLAVGIVAGWLLLVVLYYAWAIYRFNVNLGLADDEWKKLQPELYADDNELQKYVSRRRAQGNVDDETAEPDQAVQAPKRNPYEGESFGLPPGTVRGTLALTAMVLFVATEIVNVQNPGLEANVSELITAFQMVLAFYFGARAVEVLDKKRKPAAEPETQASASAPATAPSPPATEARKEEAPAVARQPASAGAAAEASPVEQPAMSSTKSAIRLLQIAAPVGSILLPPGMRPQPAAPRLLPRVLALTSSFETSVGFPDACGVATGNFDGQGLSFGVLQWNIGRGSLQPLWQRMHDEHPAVLKQVLDDESPAFERMLASDPRRQMDWALSIQRTTVRNGKTVWTISDDWKKRLMALGTSDEMIAIELDASKRRFEIALDWCREYGLVCERGVALMFDINVQNGKVDRKDVANRVRADFAGIAPSLTQDEQQVERMRIIANRRADVVIPDWREDVRRRKLTIAEGKGRVHGHDYDLQREFGLTLAGVPELGGAPAAPLA